MDFKTLERELEVAIAADEKYERENAAKFRAMDQRAATYDEFRDIVKASHLKPLAKNEKVVDPNTASNTIWNTVATGSQPDSHDLNLIRSLQKSHKKHFTEK